MAAGRGRRPVRRTGGGKMTVRRRRGGIGVTSKPQFRVRLEQLKPTIIVTDTRGRTRVLGQKPRAMSKREAQKLNAIARERRKRQLLKAMDKVIKSPGRYVKEGLAERGSDGRLRLTEAGRVAATAAGETLKRKGLKN